MRAARRAFIDARGAAPCPSGVRVRADQGGHLGVLAGSHGHATFWSFAGDSLGFAGRSVVGWGFASTSRRSLVRAQYGPLHPKLIEWLACPSCGSDLSLVVLEEGDPPDVEEGLLTCTCSSAFPVMEGVPRVLEGALATSGHFMERWGSRLEAAGHLGGGVAMPASPEFELMIAPTRDRFGKEWGEHPLEETTWGLDQETRLAHALRYLGWTRERPQGRTCSRRRLRDGQADLRNGILGRGRRRA